MAWVHSDLLEVELLGLHHHVYVLPGIFPWNLLSGCGILLSPFLFVAKIALCVLQSRGLSGAISSYHMYVTSFLFKGQLYDSGGNQQHIT